jgi:hypothetical protein
VCTASGQPAYAVHLRSLVRAGNAQAHTRPVLPSRTIAPTARGEPADMAFVIVGSSETMYELDMSGKVRANQLTDMTDLL